MQIEEIIEQGTIQNFHIAENRYIYVNYQHLVTAVQGQISLLKSDLQTHSYAFTQTYYQELPMQLFQCGNKIETHTQP